MKNNTPNNKTRTRYRFATLAAIFLPLLFIHLQYDRWNPFRLKGPGFLAFYSLLLLCTHSLRYTMQRRTTRSHGQALWRKGLFIVVLVTGLARLLQGIYNTKPVGYLVLLLALHLILLLLPVSRHQAGRPV